MRFTEELLDDDQVAANDMAVDLEHHVAGKLRMAGPLVRMSDTPVAAQAASPALGQHTSDILASLGFSPAQVQRLRDLRVTR